MDRKKILVTGGAGFIGAHTVVELHHAGYTPIVVDNFSKSDDTLLCGIEKIIGEKVVFHQGDCADKEFLSEVFEKSGTIAGVLHFAAYKAVGESVAKPLMYYQNNLDSLITLLQVMQDFQVKDFIFSSSCTVYGQPDTIPVNETAPFKRAESPYGATKQMSERILEDISLNGFRVVSLRYFNPIGAHPSALIGELPIGAPNNLVPYITQTAIGKREELTIFGNDYNTPDGTCVRDYIHVVDLANAHVRALQYLDQQESSSKLFQAFNVGTGVPVSVLELVNKFQSITGVKLKYSIGNRRAGDVEKTYADASLLQESLNWKSSYSIEDALTHAWHWEKELKKN